MTLRKVVLSGAVTQMSSNPSQCEVQRTGDVPRPVIGRRTGVTFTAGLEGVRKDGYGARG